MGRHNAKQTIKRKDPDWTYSYETDDNGLFGHDVKIHGYSDLDPEGNRFQLTKFYMFNPKDKNIIKHIDGHHQSLRDAQIERDWAALDAGERKLVIEAEMAKQKAAYEQRMKALSDKMKKELEKKAKESEL